MANWVSKGVPNEVSVKAFKLWQNGKGKGCHCKTITSNCFMPTTIPFRDV